MSPNQVIYDHRLLHFLGEGGMGEVWLAENLRTNQRVALKCLHPVLARNEQVRKRFQHEAATLRKLSHPSIVALYGYFEQGSDVFLTMEYVEGEPLDRYISQISGPIPENQAVTLFAQILDGLAHAHQQGIIHRDIKPGNFILTASKLVKILDFGIAKALDGQSSNLTKTGSRLGTVLYMSPEQVKGEALDARSDIYSLGVTLFQMVTGKCPYDSEDSEFNVYGKITQESLPRAKSIYPIVSDYMQWVIDTATAKKAKDRFQTCEEFQDALWKIVDPQAFTHPPTATLYDESTKQNPSFPLASEEMDANGLKIKRKRGLIGRLFKIAGLSILFTVILGGIYFGLVLAPEWSEKGAMRVAEEFLTAFESGDSASVFRLGSEECASGARLYLAINDPPKNRRINIRSAEIDWFDGVVNYDRNGDQLILNMRWEIYRWKVECLKTDFNDPN
jgi:serine/threonine protein kinase